MEEVLSLLLLPAAVASVVGRDDGGGLIRILIFSFEEGGWRYLQELLPMRRFSSDHCLFSPVPTRTTRRRLTVFLYAILAVITSPAVASGTSNLHGKATTMASATGKGTCARENAGEDEPNPPVWGDVTIVRPSDDPDEVRGKLASLVEDPWDEGHQTFVSDHHFSRRRHAVLFSPGTYGGERFKFQVGYYSQVAGLGSSPDAVKFVNGAGPYVPALNRHIHAPHGTCLDTFWRSGENFSVEGNDVVWAVSQASPLRRVNVKGGNLYLHDGGAYASGGHLANAAVVGGGKVIAGGQQQYLLRNVHLGGGASGGAWSMVYVGCTAGDDGSSDGSDGIHLPEPPSTTGGDKGKTTSPSVTIIDKPQVRMEKPYVALKSDGGGGGGRFELRVPRAVYDDVSGPLFDGSNERVVDFGRVRVVSNKGGDPTIRIQEALDQGKDVVLAPGIYQLSATLELRRPGQVLLGLGLATLVAPPPPPDPSSSTEPVAGGPCVHVAPKTPGVVVAGIMLEAPSEGRSRCMLEWGNENEKDPGDETDPGGLFDVFCRVGGAAYGGVDRTRISVDTMVIIHSGHIVGDNLWLWRADHADLMPGERANYPHISPIYWQTEKDEYRVETGIDVRGDDVTIYGLAVEHANGHQTVWSGGEWQLSFAWCLKWILLLRTLLYC